MRRRGMFDMRTLMFYRVFLKSALLPAAFCLLSVFLSSCSARRIDWIQVGPQFPARSAKSVAVYKSKAAPGRPWGAVGVIHGPRVPAADSRVMEKHMKEARRLAAEHGADGVILVPEIVRDTAGTMPGAEAEMFLTGVAISYKVEASTK